MNFTKLQCIVCNKPLTESIVASDGYSYHSECVAELFNSPHTGKPFCDYNSDFDQNNDPIQNLQVNKIMDNLAKTISEYQLNPESEPEPEPEPEPELESKLEPEPEQEREQEPKPEPKPTPTPKPIPKPTPTPEPTNDIHTLFTTAITNILNHDSDAAIQNIGQMFSLDPSYCASRPYMPPSLRLGSGLESGLPSQSHPFLPPIRRSYSYIDVLFIISIHNNLHDVTTICATHPLLDPNTTDVHNSSLLLLSITHNLPDIASALAIHPKIFPNIRNKTKNYALSSAIVAGMTDVAFILINNPRTKLDLLDHHSNTPLHIACKFSHPQVAIHLLNQRLHKSIITHKNTDNKTALDYARENNLDEVIRILSI